MCLTLVFGPHRCFFGGGGEETDWNERIEPAVTQYSSGSCTTASSDIIVSALADATVVVIELHELSRRIYGYTLYFINFDICHCASLPVVINV